jgi:peroxiredoxin
MVMRAGFVLFGVGSAFLPGCQALQFPSRVINQRQATHSGRGDAARPITLMVNDGRSHKHVQLNMADNGDIWSQQKDLLGEMSARAELSLKQEQLAKFAKRRNALIGDTGVSTVLVDKDCRRSETQSSTLSILAHLSLSCSPSFFYFPDICCLVGWL